LSRPSPWLSTLLVVACCWATAWPGATTNVDDLPLLELPVASNASDTFAILLSGDGGWSALDKAVARELNAHGIAVVGWDALHYFWDARTPEGAASDLDRVMRHYALSWRKSRVLLLGYSQGADTLPFMINRLPADTVRQVRATVLIGMGAEAFFEFHVSHWIGTPKGGLPTRPEVTSGRLGPVRCIYGQGDDDSACQGLRGSGVHAIPLAGGHHFDGDYATVGAAIISALAL
jgi:type IV secretory pathway VirJ component